MSRPGPTLSLIATAVLLAACAANPPAPAASKPDATQTGAAPASEAPIEPLPQAGGGRRADAAREAGTQAAQGGFATRNAVFEPANFTQLPGWQDDNLAEAWTAFRRSCGALGKKAGWDGPCQRASGMANADNAAIRAFFEREFALYEIRNADRTPEGVITGYYEPLIKGSRTRTEDFRYPVYGAPDDLLYLDLRKLPADARGKPLPARVEGRNVVPGNGAYTIELGELGTDARDKRLRVRVEGTRVVPYYTRAEIERGGLRNARVLLWVDNAAAFYSMQIQGSGKVRMPDGQIVRLAYAEQNGHPFTPPVAKRASDGASKRVRTRGLGGPSDEPLVVDLLALGPTLDAVAPAEAGPEPAADAPRTRGIQPVAGASGAASNAPGGVANAPARPLPRANQPLPSDVERLVEQLATGRPAGAKPASAANATPQPGPAEKGPVTKSVLANPKPVAGKPAAAERADAVADAQPMEFPKPSAEMLAAISNDKSFVFFREIPDSPEGPLGALGVPLTAGRSVAVDPRTTPLGFPVFVSTMQPGRAGRLNRLVMAQDTGGAIRGAVRADYFWGAGNRAYAQAARMKESGRMWLLMPRGQQIAARDTAVKTRGLGNLAASADCVIADPELCGEDR